MTGQTSRVPTLVTLTGYDCWGLLETQDIARIAWTTPDGVAVRPVNYTVADGSLWFRTEPHSELGRQCGGARVAVEVDHVDRASRTAWSVIVTGTARLVSADEMPDAAMEMRVWPAGVRNLFVRVEPIEVTGRRL